LVCHIQRRGFIGGGVGVIEERMLRKIFWYNKKVRKNKNFPSLTHIKNIFF